MTNPTDPARSAAPSRRRPAIRATADRPAALVLEREACHDLANALEREWIETDGRGGYAASTVLMCPTRRQHGLLVAPCPGNPKRHVYLARYEETLDLQGRTFPLSIARYPSLWSPHGHLSLERFEGAPWPRSVHRVGDATITREILMTPGSPAVLVRYRLQGAPGPAALALRPLLPFREADALTVENGALSPRASVSDGGVLFRPYPELPALGVTVGGAAHRFVAEPAWYRNVEHATDAARGYESHEDQFSPGTLTLTLVPGQDAVVAATVGPPVTDPVAAFEAAARSRRSAWNASSPDLRGLLAYGADRFLARAPTGRPTVVAGWPWFYEWGRDTFLSVPGLHFARGRVEEGGDVLEGALAFLEGGLFPNRFGVARTDSDFHSADAPFLFARAVRLYEVAGGSPHRVRDRFFPALASVVAAWERGTALGKEDADGLPSVGSAEANLTWMDARVDGHPVTPRWGCPVEIAALWVHLRRYLADLTRRLGSAADARTLGERASASASAFLARFWLPRQRYLADGWRDGRPDATIRPNMVLAAALEWSPLSHAQCRDVVATAEAELLTPRGLRTLDPSHASYQPRYEGDVVARDRAYHQGTVWPWLLGAYVEASLAAHGRSKAVVARLRAVLDGLAPATEEFGLGHLAEVYSADPPHGPGGTFAQAWSDAEVLRAYALLEGARR